MLVTLALFGLGLIFPLLLIGALMMLLISLKEYNTYKAWQKGFEGESKVIDELYIPGSILLSDIHLPGKKGNIDHVLVSSRGVFVLETKNYSGEYWVSGDTWKTRGYGRRRRGKIAVRSPAVEVKKEATAVSSFLKKKLRREYTVHPIIVLTGDAKIHGIKSSEIPILHLEDVPVYINKFPNVLTQRDIFEISQTLEEYAAHIKDMRTATGE
nr:nuclease-related domain-containing protein [Thermococcus sp. M36]